MIRIVDYGIGNVAAIVNMLRSARVEAEVTADAAKLLSASRLILAGVGAFDAGMRNLHARHLVPVLREAVFERGIPMLGICLGMQLLMRGSDEGSAEGLGWIEGRSVRIRSDGPVPIKVPHMGWNEVQPVRASPLLAGLERDGRFYFAHSYAVEVTNAGDVVAHAVHGKPFPAIVAHGRVAGVQFHPEKSHKYGRRLLTNFATGEPQ
jgi:glutamine amidotransferase